MRKLLLLLLLPLLPVMANADDSGQCGDYVTYTFEETSGTLTITGDGPMTSYDTRLYIPKLPWNDYKDQIKKLIIKPGITFISEYAFFQCHFLTSATIANSVTKMGEAAFSGCIRLSDLALSTNLTSIPNYCLAACHALKAITIPDRVSFIGSDAFNDCTSLVSVRLRGSGDFLCQSELNFV